ncbi:hypothetical protein CPB86DRAFT_826821 [Serendipita vermifera]|nr:hypothetical protein CPB86DRAFT_826821 [Serendipita vermifera]
MTSRRPITQLRDPVKNLHLVEEDVATGSTSVIPDHKGLITPIFPFNYVFSDEEILSLHESLKAYEGKDRSILEQAEEVVALMEAFKDQQAEVRREMMALKWALSTFRRLPDDVIIELLKICVLEVKICPYLLSQVCKKFHFLILRTPKIWSQISIDSCDHGKWPPRYSDSHNCRTLKDLQTILKRSGIAPLDISVCNASLKMIQTLLAERHRWRYLRFQRMQPLRRNQCIEDPSEKLFQSSNSPSNLEKFVLASDCHKNVLAWVVKAKPLTLRLTNCTITPWSRIKWWHELNTLEIEHLLDKDRKKAVCGILASLRTQLRSLSLRLSDSEEFNLEECIEFPRLQYLKLREVDHWWDFHAPKLVSLSLHPPRPAPPTATLTYTNLLELKYNAEFAALSWETLSAPKLVSMRLLYPTLGEPGTNFVWSTSDGTLSGIVAKEINIVSYSKDATKIGYKDMLASLWPHTTLTKLHLSGLKLPLTFYKAFIKGNSEEAMLCPQLCEFIINLAPITSSIDAAKYHKVFETLARDRRQSNSPLNLLHITWPSSTHREPKDYMMPEV